MPKLKEKPESIVILGMGPSFMDYHNDVATQDRKEDIADEIWTINAASFDHRTDRIWWMDDLKKERVPREYTIDRLAWLDVPVMTSTAYPEIAPLSITYPLNEACDLSMDVFGKVYFNNTIAYALAYAILVGIKRIAAYGCDFTYINRNFAESGRACVEAWMVAYKSLGGELRLPKGTHLFDNAGRVDQHGKTVGHELYGYDKQPTVTMKDGKEVYYGKPEIDLINDEIIRLMNDGPGKNADEIERLNRRIGGVHLANEIERAESHLEHLKRQEVENAVRTPEPGTNGSGAGSVLDGPTGHTTQAGDPLPGGSLRGGGNGRQPSQEGSDAANAERGDAGGVQGDTSEAVAAGEGTVAGRPGEVAPGSPAG